MRQQELARLASVLAAVQSAVEAPDHGRARTIPHAPVHGSDCTLKMQADFDALTK
jgi:hypothetical protein